MATFSSTQSLPRVRDLMPRIPILDRYLLGEMIGPFLFAFSGFLLFWALNIFFIAADYLINQHAPFFLVLRFVVFRIPQAIPMAFPFASLFATLLAMGRLMGDGEVTAIRTAGVSLGRFVITPILFGILAFTTAYLMNEYIAPPAVDLSTRTFYQIIYHTSSLPVEPQFFRKDPDTGNVFYVTQVLPDNKTMEGVQIFRPGRDGFWNETVQAKTATLLRGRLELHDAIQTRYNPSGMVVSQQHVKNMYIGLPLGEAASQFMSSVNSDPWTMSSKTLSTQVNALKAQGIGGSTLGNLEINLADKTAWPFACVVGVLLSLPLALRFGKRGRMLGFGMAILAFFIYYLLTTAFAALGRNNAFNPTLAAWTPNILFGVAGVVMLWLEER